MRLIRQTEAEAQRALHAALCSTQSVLKAIGSYLRLRPESDMIRFAFRKLSLASVWRMHKAKE